LREISRFSKTLACIFDRFNRAFNDDQIKTKKSSDGE